MHGGYTPHMSIKRRKRPNGRIYLEEWKTVRVDGKPKSFFVRSLGPEDPVQKGKPKPKRAVLDRLDHGSSHRAGDVTLLWHIAEELGMIETIDTICCAEAPIEGVSPGKLMTVWAINRVIDPQSATQLAHWVPTTDLPRLSGINPADFTKDAFLGSLDFICYEDRPSGQIVDHTPEVDDALFRRWRRDHPLPMGEGEMLTYDITTVLIFGVSCPLAEFGYNPDEIHRRQVNIALLVTKSEKYPMAHFVYGGSRPGKSTIPNLLARLQEAGATPGTIVWDRGNVSADNIKEVEKAKWNLICGIPKSVKGAKHILGTHSVPASMDTLVKVSDGDHIYATTVKGNLYGKERTVTLYLNRERGVRDTTSRHDALLQIDEEVKHLIRQPWTETENDLREKVKRIVGDYDTYVNARVRRGGPHPMVKWSFQKRKIRKAEELDGLYVLYSTDESIPAKEVVNTYLEKDYIEKVFSTMKSIGEIEPIRHRLEQRVRAYMFVNVLAYRIQAALQHHLQHITGLEKGWERPGPLLRELSRVERVQIRLGRETKTMYLNVTNRTDTILEKMGHIDLFKSRKDVDYDV